MTRDPRFNYCPACRYPIAGLDGRDVCPECGASTTEGAIQLAIDVAAKRLRLRGWIALLSPLCAIVTVPIGVSLRGSFADIVVPAWLIVTAALCWWIAGHWPPQGFREKVATVIAALCLSAIYLLACGVVLVVIVAAISS